MEPTGAEVDAAFQVGGKMLEAALTPGGKPVKVIEIFRAALTAAAQVRYEQAVRDKVLMYDKAADTLRKGSVVQAPTEPAEASRDHPDKDIKVQCKCGWIGRQSELHWPASPSTAYFCPRCHKSFSSWTLAERSITSPDGTVFLYHEPYT